MNNISMVGIGKLGLCFALTLEKNDYNVLGCDVNEDYINSLNNKSFLSEESGVNDLLKNSTNFRATSNLQDCVNHSNIIFILVATPSLPNGKYDHSQVEKVIHSIVSYGTQPQQKHLVICCTTMPEYCDTVHKKLTNLNYIVSYNPEFIAQGTILNGQSYPDLVLIGEGDTSAGDIIEEIYVKSARSNPTIARMSRTQAEICKISLNCFLTTKISFANMVGDIAYHSGVDPVPILQAIGADSRIGNKYLKYGYGYGGPCFPRDNRALAIYAKEKGIEALISIASDEFNKEHLQYQVDLFKAKNDMAKPITLDHITYKPESTMIEESQQLLFAVKLAQAGYAITLRERVPVIEEVKELYGDLFSYEKRSDEL